MAVALDITLSMQSALQSKIAVLSNNAANAGTVGFQADSIIFSEFLGQSDGLETYSYLDDIATVRDMKLGALERTGNPFHVALQADGYFAVQTPQGIRYTRSGAFTVNSEGIVVDLNGDPVLSADGGEIIIPADSQNIMISQDGTVSDENGILAQLGIFGFDNEYDMEKVGNTQLKTDQAATPLGDAAKVIQGALEQANLNPILNMTEMMQASKLYALNQRYIEEQLKLEAKQTDMLVTTAPVS